MLQDRILVVIDAASSGAVKELQGLERSAKSADDSVVNLGKSLKTGLVAGGAALAAGGLVSFLNDSVQAFQESQVAAQQFARATNSTIVEAGKFTTVARTLGLEMNDLIEINAEFSKKIEEQPALLDQLNVQVSKNADGSTNMTRTLVETIDALGQMEDGLKAAQIAAQLFGEEGSKQLAGFYLQGIQVADLMDRIDFIDQSEQAKKFAASTIEMNLAMEQLQVTLGAEIVPLMTTLADVGTDVIGFLTQVPTEVYLAVGAFVALRAAANAGIIQGVGLAALQAALNFGVLAARVGVVRAAFSGLTATLAANPITAALVVATAGYTAYSIASDNARSRTEAFVQSWVQAQEASGSFKESLDETAQSMLSTASNTERFVTALNNSGVAFSENSGVVNRLADAVQALFDDDRSLEDYREALRQTRLEMGEFAVAAGAAEDTQLDLNNEVAKFVNSGGAGAASTWKDIALAAEQAAEAQAKTDETTRIAAEAFAIAAGDVGFFVDQLSRIDLIAGVGIDALAQRLAEVDWVPEDLGTKFSEVNIQLQAEAQNIWSTIKAEVEQASAEGITWDAAAFFADLRAKAGPEAEAVIALVEAAVNGDKGIQASLGLIPAESFNTTKDELAGLEDPTIGTFDLTTGQGVADATAAKENLGTPIETTLTVDTSFEPGGYNAVKARKDFLSKAVDTDLAIDVSFGPGGYNAVKARKDYLSQNRTAYIDVVVRGAAAAAAQLDSLRSAAVAGAAQVQTIQPIVNNRLRIDLDGQQLRGLIREEVRLASAPAWTAVP